MSERSASPCVPTVRVTEPNPVPSRLGVFRSGDGLDVSVVARGASGVDMCIFDEAGAETRFALIGPHTGIWHGHIPGFGAGTRYGFRVHGPWDPDGGKFYNSHKLLLDPYGRGVDGVVDMKPGVYAHCVDEDLYPSEYPLRRSPIDSAAYMPRSVVVEPSFPIEPQPHTPWETTVIYEIHVKGFTKNMPGVPPQLRGTYAGLAHPASVSYLKDLGVTAVELLPVHAKCDEPFLTERGLTNYWGYSTLSFFAPEPSYATEASRERGAQAVVDEFRGMVSLLHQAGIEVILDVVYNHTAEGNHMGPTLSFRGIDNPSYYRLVDGDRQHYFDTTGTGNSLLMSSPQVLQLIMDSLRYWVTEMHVDGFRFDLASTLARQFAEVDRLSAFFDLIHQDPVVSQVKLIAEPWDVGSDGYQVGGFPPLWSEWNGRYRDTVRDFWRGEFSSLPDFASRLAGSSDLYGSTGRKPMASINFITAHDGFTLRDLVSYNEKHNEANLEGGADGANDNRSWNCGVEGDTDDEEIIELRYRQQRNFLTTLIFSQGVPMIAHGDELGRTQRGNNNAYCQDNELSWINWDLDEHDYKLLRFTRDLIHLRRDHPVMRRRRFLEGPARRGGESSLGEIEWFTPAGTHMTEEEWNQPWARSTMVFYNGEAIREPDANGRRILDDDFLLLINAAPEAVDFTLPDANYGHIWHTVVDTAGDDDHKDYQSGDVVHVGPRTAFILRNPRGL